MIDQLNYTGKSKLRIDLLNKYFEEEMFISIDDDITHVILEIGNPIIQEIIEQPEFEYEMKEVGFINKNINYGFRDNPTDIFIDGKRIDRKVRDWNDTLTLTTYIDN